MFVNTIHGTVWNSLASSRRRRTIFGLLCRKNENVNVDNDCHSNESESVAREANNHKTGSSPANLIFVRADRPADCQAAHQMSFEATTAEESQVVELADATRNVETIARTLAEAKSRGIYSILFVADGQVQRMQIGDGYSELEHTMAFVNKHFGQSTIAAPA